MTAKPCAECSLPRAGRWPWISAILCSVSLATPLLAGSPVKVEGYFCDAKADQLAFLRKKADGENEVMASNSVNKELGKASCVPYIVADAVPTSEQTVIDQGLVYVLRSYTFLPEKVERWHGTVTGSLQQSAQQRDI